MNVARGKNTFASSVDSRYKFTSPCGSDLAVDGNYDTAPALQQCNGSICRKPLSYLHCLERTCRHCKLSVIINTKLASTCPHDIPNQALL